jgi:hypothetical protein
MKVAVRDGARNERGSGARRSPPLQRAKVAGTDLISTLESQYKEHNLERFVTLEESERHETTSGDDGPRIVTAEALT